MIKNIDIYFLKDRETPHKNAEENYQIRKNKACEQVKESPARLSQVFDFVNEILICLEEINGETCNTIQIDALLLDEKEHTIINKGIIVRGCKWIKPVWNKTMKKYSIWEPKYSLIKNKFGISHTKNLIWLKFTQKGYLGVVAKGMDINFDNELISGRLINEVGDQWDESFVLIFPLTDLMLKGRNTGDIERAVGNYLISKKIPIIDYYSHNYGYK